MTVRFLVTRNYWRLPNKLLSTRHWQKYREQSCKDSPVFFPPSRKRKRRDLVEKRPTLLNLRPALLKARKQTAKMASKSGSPSIGRRRRLSDEVLSRMRSGRAWFRKLNLSHIDGLDSHLIHVGE